MGMTMKHKVKFNHLGNLKKRIKALDKQKAEIGYFASQGTHPSGLTYTGLFALQSFGSSSTGLPPRPVMEYTFADHPVKKNTTFKRDLHKYFSNIKNTHPPITITLLLENVSGDYVEKIRGNFGNTSILEDNAPVTQRIKAAAGLSPTNSPLIWSGNLRDNLSYSINGESVITP